MSSKRNIKNRIHRLGPNPIGRVIYERATGRIMGPISPISAEDWPFQTVLPSETLWRYMDLWKFEDLLKTRTLYFTRPDQFTDPFEGRLTPGNDSRKSESDKVFHQLYKIRMTEPREYHEIHRNLVFINCWHRNKMESREMWHAYTSTSESIVIATSVNALMRFLPEQLMKFAVKYHSLHFPRTEFSHNSLFFYKPQEYAFEREFRLLRSPEQHEKFHSEDPNDRFRRIAIHPRKLIHRVIAHPNANAKTRDFIQKLLLEYIPGIKLQSSSLLA